MLICIQALEVCAFSKDNRRSRDDFSGSNESVAGRITTTCAEKAAAVLGVSDGLVQDSVQALDEAHRVFERNSFKEESLLKEKPCGILHFVTARVC